jgi:ADP-ribosylglycohydrolase
MSQNSSRRLGLVAGTLVGCALGAPFAHVKGAHIAQLLDGARAEGYLGNPVIFPDRPDKNTLPGLHAIHAQEFLAILSAAHDDESGRQPLARAAARLRELAGDDMDAESSGALRHPGRPLKRSLVRWAEGFPWDEEEHFACAETSEGASLAVRALACVLVEGTSPVDAARLTHTREAPLIAACIVSGLARHFLAVDNPKKIDAMGILDDLIAQARAAEDKLREGPVRELWRDAGWGMPRARLSTALECIASLLRTKDDALAEKTLVAQAQDFAPEQAVASVHHGFAPVIIPWIVYKALGDAAPANLIEATLNDGGETPVSTALMGGLCGARWGVEHIPEEWLDGCHAWPAAKRLAEAPDEAAAEEWLATERRLSTREEDMRTPLREALRKREAEDGKAPKKKPKKEEPLPTTPTEKLPFAPPPQAWLEQKGDELAPWEKRRLKTERGRKRIDWKEERRERKKIEGGEE